MHLAFLYVALAIITISPSVLCQQILSNAKVQCIDCCNENVQLFGRVNLCLEGKWCQDGIWGDREGILKNLDLRDIYFVNATYAIVYPNSVINSIRRCTVQNFPKMHTIYAENMEITVVEVRAFWNLTSLRKVHLAFNFLREVQLGVFSTLPIEMLDLSWNRIAFIGDNAFSGMNNLKYLNLSHNELTVVELIQYNNFPLKDINLSHNLLTKASWGWNFHISVADLSFNKLIHFAILYQRDYKLIDLTNNHLSSLLFAGSTVDDLRLSLNNLTDWSMLANKEAVVKNITLFPNPWKCENVSELLKVLHQKNTTIMPPDIDKRLTFVYKDYPICANPDKDAYYEYDKGRDNFIKDDIRFCKSDSHCPTFMICRTGMCSDPCKYDACRDKTKECRTKDHKISCTCPKGTLSNPNELFTNCYIPCFIDSHCPKDFVCGMDHICTPYYN